jgi:glucose-6-phosphate isomerase
VSDFLQTLRNLESHTWYSLADDDTAAFQSAMEKLASENVAARIWSRDGSVWSQDSAVAARAESMLGWLDLPGEVAIDALRLKALAVEANTARLERVVLLGMGGSSLAPEVLRHVFGVAPDHLDLSVLDSTDPAQIMRIEAEGDIAHTLFLVSSKSGTTAETLSLYEYFRARVRDAVGRSAWAKHFVAITDHHTPLEKLARDEGFRAVYNAPASVGGRYSAISPFGLVPAALLGIDLDTLATSARQMAWLCRGTAPAQDNAGLVLGAIMGALVTMPRRRDKLTLVTSPGLAAIGVWIEQLVAESTGKQGVGILPVEGEAYYDPDQYGSDRLFVYIRLEGDDNDDADAHVARLAEAGHPVVALPVRDRYDLAAEFFRWEFATAVAGHLLGINPFDQPDVESAKERARQALARYEETHALPEEEPALTEGDMAVWGPALDAEGLEGYLRAFLQQAGPDSYVALMAYIDRRPDYDELMQAMRRRIGESRRVAVTVGYGPRFLHSTGQLHKGGADNGLFLQITQDEPRDLAIPGRTYTFGVLKQAQALGDMEALRHVGRQPVRLNLGADVKGGLEQLVAMMDRVLAES